MSSQQPHHTPTIQRRLEGPGSEDRIRRLNQRFRTISARAFRKAPDWKFWLLVVAVFVVTGAIALLW